MGDALAWVAFAEARHPVQRGIFLQLPDHAPCVGGLLRFGAELVFALCEARQVEIVILNKGEDTTFEEDLAKDVLEIITVFSTRLYGSRSRKNQKLLDGIKKAVDDAGDGEP